MERVSVWLFNNNEDELRCIDLYEVMYDRHSYDGVLKRCEYEHEFDALSTAKFIDADDPLTDPRTAGYVNSYLKPNRITSMLDALIRVSGQNLGVLCFEHVDRSHHWENDEIAFACQLADQVAITLLNRDRYRAEEALKVSEGKLNAMLQSIPDHMSMIDKDLNLLWTNETAKRVFGDDIVGKKCYEIYHLRQKSCEPYPCLTLRAFQDGKVHKHETSVLDVNGQTIYFECSANVALNDENGNPVAVLEVSRDITERKVAEEALRLSGMKFQRLVEATPDMIWEIDPQGNFTYISPQCTNQIGYTPEELIGKSMFSMVKPESIPSIRDQFLLHVRNKQSFNLVEVPAYHRNGDAIVIEIRSVLIADDQGEIIGFQGIARNITERKRAEKALRQANKKLTLLSSITRHDINNQLTVQMGYLNLLEKKQIDATHNEYFQKVSTVAKRISAMIQFTKEYEEIGVHAPSWQECRTLLDTASKLAPLGKVMVKNNLPANAEVFADPLVVKVFYNLMDNAARYGGKCTTIRFSVEETGDDQVIVCEDNGSGVVAEEKEKIFERGFGKNTGLGLALSREILSITGITITETGEPGKGARFEMVVPKGAWRATSFA